LILVGYKDGQWDLSVFYNDNMTTRISLPVDTLAMSGVMITSLTRSVVTQSLSHRISLLVFNSVFILDFENSSLINFRDVLNTRWY